MTNTPAVRPLHDARWSARHSAPLRCRYRYVMTSPVKAWPDERTGWIRTGDFAVPSRFRASASVDGFDVRLLVVVGERGPGAIEVTIEQLDGAQGEPVTHRVLRKLTIDQIVRDAAGQLSRPVRSAEEEAGIPGAYRVEGLDEIFAGRSTPHTGRGRDTPRDRLIRVADIYQTALSRGSRSPVKAVADELPSSRSNAGRLVGQARAAGLLSETVRGQAGADAKTTPDAKADTEAKRDPGPSSFRDPAKPWPGQAPEEGK